MKTIGKVSILIVYVFLISLLLVPQQGVAAGKTKLFKVSSAFPTHLEVLGTTLPWFADKIDAASDGAIKIKVYEPGKLMPALQIHEAVSTGKINGGYTASAYIYGKVKAATFFCTVPFNLDPIGFLSWFYEGNGMKLYQEMYDNAGYNVKAFPLGLLAPEAGGWFTKRVDKPEDLQGVKIRIGGYAAQVYQKAGATTVLFPIGEVFSSLEKGVIDGAEMSSPAVDMSSGLYKVAKYYYFPGWQQQSTMIELIINKDDWNSLSKAQQTMFEMTVQAANVYSMTRSSTIQHDYIKQIEEKGTTEIVRWSDETLQALYEAWIEVIEKEAAGDAFVKKVWDDLKKFGNEYGYWRKVGFVPDSIGAK